MDEIARKSKSELKLLGVTVNKHPCDSGTLNSKICLLKAISRLYILGVCKLYSYSLRELTLLFDCLAVSFFTSAIDVWACAHYSEYLSQIDRFCKEGGSSLWLYLQIYTHN